jgi:hypothetical protein
MDRFWINKAVKKAMWCSYQVVLDSVNFASEELIWQNIQWQMEGSFVSVPIYEELRDTFQ